MGFFNLTKPVAPVAPVQQTPAVKAKESSLMTIPEESEVETYEDDKPLSEESLEEDSETSTPSKSLDDSENDTYEPANDSYDSETDEETPEEVELKAKLDKIAKDKLAKKEAEKRALENAKNKSSDNYQQPQIQQVPVYLSEAEFLREMMNRIQGIEQWASDLTSYLKSRDK